MGANKADRVAAEEYQRAGADLDPEDRMPECGDNCRDCPVDVRRECPECPRGPWGEND
jgi:hypothetical protein